MNSTNRNNRESQPGLEIVGMEASYGKSVAVANLDLEIGSTEFVTLLGPSGCGKTTTLRCVAGLHSPSDGEIRLGSRPIFGGGVNVPPNKRDINMVFQSYAVWPHMTTLENVMYGLKAQKLDSSKARTKARSMLELVGLSAYENRHATDLSGGQQQRVALARALATEPSLVLMDEPLSNLDAQLRARMRNEIRQIQKDTQTSVMYVTHDQAEALSMSDRVVVMKEGVIQQVGDPWTLYHRPANRFVSTFVGDANLVSGRVIQVRTDSFTVALPSLGEGTEFDVALDQTSDQPVINQEVSIVFRPEWVSFASETARGAGRNQISAKLLTSEFLGSHFDRRYQAGAHTLRVQAVTGPTSRPPRTGGEQLLVVTPENVTWFPSDSDEHVSEMSSGDRSARECIGSPS